MITQILTNTPIWVFLLFILLLVFGLMQTRSRWVSKLPALLLPWGMIALSLAGVQSSFGLRPVTVAAWGLTLIATALIGYLRFKDQRVLYDQQMRKFFIPGGWTPFVVIMTLFFTKYVFAVIRGFNAHIMVEPSFIISLCMTYGLFSGYFASKAINLIAQTRQPSNFLDRTVQHS